MDYFTLKSEVYYYDETVVKMNNINSGLTDIGQYPIFVSQIIAFASACVQVQLVSTFGFHIIQLYPRRQSGISGTF